MQVTQKLTFAAVRPSELREKGRARRMRQPVVHEMFRKMAAEHAARVAIASKGRELTYAQVEAWSNNIANHLLELGAGKGAIVYLAVETTFGAVAAMLAVLKIGGVFVPVDPHQPEARLRVLTARVVPAFILTEQRALATVLEKIATSLPIIPIDLDEPSDESPALVPPRTADGTVQGSPPPPMVSEPDDMCYVYFTSGSTGQPKAIAGRLKGIDHFVRWEMETFEVQPGTRVSQLTSLVFDAFLRDAFTTLCAGGTMCVPDSRDDVLDAKRLITWLDRSQVELVHAVPSLFRTILAEPLTAELFPALRYVLLAGEPLLPSDVRRWTEVFGDRIRLVNLYGPTETTMVKLFYIVKPEDAARRSVPVGRAMPGARALVIDENGRPAALGAVGEIYLRTEFCTLGYYNDPELTAQVFVPNPSGRDPSDLVYRTGDLGRMLDDGNIEFLGRKDQQVKIRGVRVELGEIESALLATGLVSEAAAVSRSDRLGNAYLCAYVVLKQEGKEGDLEALRRAVAASLPSYLVPSTFVKVDRMPRTSTGKIDRKALPAPEDTRAAVEPIAPRNEMETEVARLFAEVLGLDRVGVNEEFFQLGGHSLLAMGLISRLTDRFDVEVPLAALFEASTVEMITRYIEDRRQSPPPPGSSSAAGGLVPDAEHRVSQLSEAAVDSLLADVLGAKVS